MPAQRTTEHFKFRNRAVRQATYLGVDKVILITIAEFCHDDGIFWHGHRTIARTSGVSLGQAYKSIQKFIKDGVLVLLKKGKSGNSTITSTYQFNLDNLPEHPSVYDLVKQHPEIDRSYSERTNDSDVTPTQEEDLARSYSERKRSSGERTDDARSYSERQPFTTRTEGVDFDVDLHPGVNTSRDSAAASPPVVCPSSNLDGSQGQNQNRVGVHGQTIGDHGQWVNGKKAEEARRVVYAPKWKPAAFEEGERKSNPNPKTNGNASSPVPKPPLPLVANRTGEDCAYCFSRCGHPHHKNCFVVTGRFS
jgi:hypothetical protein